MRRWQLTWSSLSTTPYSLEDLKKDLLIAVVLKGTYLASARANLLMNETLTIENIELMLQEVEAAGRGGHANFASPDELAYAATGTCHWCNSSEHYKRDCKDYLYHRGKYQEGKSKPSLSNNNNKRCPKGKGKARANAAASPERGCSPSPVRLELASLSQQANSSQAQAQASALSTTRSNLLTNHWNADSGATSHMTPRREWFKTYAPCNVPIRVANGVVVRAVGVGSVEFAPTKDRALLPPVIITDVLHVPDLNQNLFSVLSVTRKSGVKVSIDANAMDFHKDGELILSAPIGNNNVALLDGKTLDQSANAASDADELWHKRFAHIGQTQLEQLFKENLVDGLPSKLPEHLSHTCCYCHAGKHARAPYNAPVSRCSKPLELVHSDLKGPLPPTASGYRYWITFIDDASQYCQTWVLHTKAEAYGAFLDYKAWAEKQTGHKLKALRDNKGGEYISNEWNDFMREHGIERQHTTRNAPQSNGVAERTNRILDEGVSSMLSAAGLRSDWWAYALSAYVHVLNRSPSSSVKGKVPHEAFYGRKPSVRHLRVFGCKAYVHVPKDQRRAFEPKTREMVFVGYPVDMKGWQCWDPVTDEVLVSRDVKFDKTVFPGFKLDQKAPAYVPERLAKSGPVGERDDSVDPPQN